MDAVAVSMAEGMQEPKMKSKRSLMLSGEADLLGGVILLLVIFLF